MARPRLAVAVVLLVALATPTAIGGEDLRDLVARLDGKDWKARSAAYRALIEKRDPAALPLLRRALPGFGWSGQYYGVLVVDRYAARNARRTWRALLEAAPPYLRVAAATALLRSGNEEGLDAGSAALVAPGVTPAVRGYMILRLGARPHPRLLEAVRTLLRPDQNLAVLLRVFTLLHQARDRGAVPHVAPLLADAPPGVQALAAAYLYGLGHIEHADTLARTLRAGVGNQEFALVRTILPAGRSLPDEVLDALTARLGEEKNVSRIIAHIKYLGAHRHHNARRTLIGFLSHANASVARAAFDVLAQLSGPLRDDTLKPLLRGADIGRRLWAAEALRQRGSTSGVATVVLALQSGSVAERKEAARILATFTMDLAVEPLLDALEDEDAAIRAAALTGVQTLLGRLFPYRRLALATTGYAPQASASVRKEAVARIRTWWATNRNADW